MLKRRVAARLLALLRSHPVVALVGPRQVGKTTLARTIGDELSRDTTYLDLERPRDRARLADAELFLGKQQRKLTILDEVQRMPELFPLLRSLVDERIRSGEKSCQFLVLGSASPELVRRSSASLAGRVAWLELAPFTLDEVAVDPEAVSDLRDRTALLDHLLHDLDLELAAVLSAGRAHRNIFLPEPCDSELGVHFFGATSLVHVTY